MTKGKQLIELDPAMEEYVANVAGGPPPDFNERMEKVRKLHELACATLGIDPKADLPEQEAPTVFERLQDLMLLAACSYSMLRHEGRGENLKGFIQRAKQIARWMERPIPEQTPLSMLECQARELARMIARRLFRGDEFVLVIANSGEGGHMTWISSIDRNTTIKLLDEFVGHMKEDQAKRS